MNTIDTTIYKKLVKSSNIAIIFVSISPYNFTSHKINVKDDESGGDRRRHKRVGRCICFGERRVGGGGP
ncbi:hypothetical protein AAHA92_16603 [Salvia divinorum]|uniref:Uncharacterized protein n=1 Tax=Salvia divinorum TaxID=28513 RepID=A0ABD1GW27_SALDI